MITCSEAESARKRALKLLQKAGVTVRQDEIDQMEVADFGLGELEVSGVQIITLVDTDRIAAKLLVLLPLQTEPEHRHPSLGPYEGKEETIRCEWGLLYLYGPGDPASDPRARPPEGRRHTYTAWHESVLHPGDQVTLPPDVPHWFQAGPEGAVVWSFSTKATDAADIFTDPAVRRRTEILDDTSQETHIKLKIEER